MPLPPWRTGARVRVRGRRWQIASVEAGDDCTALGLRDPADGRSRALTVLTPFDRPATLDRPAAVAVVRPRRLLHALDRAMAATHPFGGLTQLARTGVRVLPYQLDPALALLRHGRTRLLIADGVGLGKTIEAGLMLLELSAAADAFRAIVVTPAGLREQWQRELLAHFQLASELADSAWLRRSAVDRPAEINPWSLPGIYVASHDFIKRPEVLRPLEDVAWDIVVVDEAHAVTSRTDRRAAIHAVACRALRLLLLTATPHAGDPLEFAALCGIGRIEAREPKPTLFARSRQDVDPRAGRRAHVLPVASHPLEVAMHRVLEAYSDRVWREAAARRDVQARLVSIVLRKRALSSAGSLLASVHRRLDLLRRGSSDAEARQLVLPLHDDEDPLDDAEPAAALAAPGLSDPSHEHRWLSAVAEAARAASRDESKTRWLLRFLRRVREPVIVFTEYRDTLVRLARRLAISGRSIAVVHGGLDPRERGHVIASLETAPRTLLATDAAAEGLNLHHHCRIVIHYELPWNPARLEQRAGRVDRIGQRRRVHEIALVSSTTAERLVLAPLARRSSMDGAGQLDSRLMSALTESHVAEAVMSGAAVTAPDMPSVDRFVAAPPDVGNEARLEALRLERIRTLLARSEVCRERTRTPQTVACRLRSKSRQSGQQLIVIYDISVEDGAGRSAHAEQLIARIPIPADISIVSSAQLRALIREVTRAHSRSAWIDAWKTAVADRIVPLVEHRQKLLAERHDAIERACGAAARRIVQLRLIGPGVEREREWTQAARPGLEPAAVRDVLTAAILWTGGLL